MRSRRNRRPLVHERPKKADEVKSDINVTPLVDVCLVLLIIFMVVTPMLTRGMDVSLPKTLHHEEHKDTGSQPIVSVVKDGAQSRMYFDRDVMATPEALQARVKEELKHSNGMPIFMKADADLTWKDVYPAIMAVHDADSPGIQLGTAEKKE